MRRSGRRIGGAAALFTVVGCASAAPEAPPAPATLPAVEAGLFTDRQLERGTSLFNDRCATCHAPREFSGRSFELSWGGRPVGEFFQFIRTAMPYDQPGSLEAQQYVDVTAYVLSLNGYAAGDRDLPPDTARLNHIVFGQEQGR
jgi:S-disulfanyl-L-cysteine oxidoreductase SoxD